MTIIIVRIGKCPCLTAGPWYHDLQTLPKWASLHDYNNKSEWEAQCSSSSQSHCFRAGQMIWVRSMGKNFRGDRQERLSSVPSDRWLPADSHSNMLIKSSYLRIKPTQRNIQGLEMVAPLRTWFSLWMQLLLMPTIPIMFSYVNNLSWGSAGGYHSLKRCPPPSRIEKRKGLCYHCVFLDFLRSPCKARAFLISLIILLHIARPS